MTSWQLSVSSFLSKIRKRKKINSSVTGEKQDVVNTGCGQTTEREREREGGGVTSKEKREGEAEVAVRICRQLPGRRGCVFAGFHHSASHPHLKAPFSTRQTCYFRTVRWDGLQCNFPPQRCPWQMWEKSKLEWKESVSSIQCLKFYIIASGSINFYLKKKKKEVLRE